MKRFLAFALFTITVLYLTSCDDFLNVVPENTATIEKSFKMRGQAEKALFTCYSYLTPASASRPIPFFASSGAVLSSLSYRRAPQISLGNQKVVNPYFNYWEGRNLGRDLYEAIRKCNTFINNIHQVTNMTEDEKEQWAAEAKFLKAYYHFFLTRMYGPIVLYKENISSSAPDNKVNAVRAPVDSTFNYIVKLLDEAINTPQLPARITNRQRDLGRITKSVAYAMKVKVLVTAASPLFNGNNDYQGFQNKNGDNPFNTEEDPTKWDKAAAAAKEAIDFVEANNFTLYEYQPTARNAGIDDSTKLKMTIRNSFAGGQDRPKPGIIWARPSVNDYAGLHYHVQALNTPRGIENKNPSDGSPLGRFGPTLQIAEMFYSENGVPIEQDKSWDYNGRYNIQSIDEDERFYLKEGYTTAKLNMDREPRYYASLGFDGSIWYGNGYYSGGPDAYTYIRAKAGQINALSTHQGQNYSPTGYWVKKLVNYNTRAPLPGESYGMQIAYYNWPIIRLTDLYLLYAEAKNEADGPGPEVYEYLNKVREHAGIPTVQEAWSQWSTNPNQYQSKSGLRDIIHRERLIELAFEEQRIWDLKRWKKAHQIMNEPMRGWNREYAEAEQYYTPKTVSSPTFQLKDYFWPISERELNSNTNLTQNPGW